MKIVIDENRIDYIDENGKMLAFLEFPAVDETTVEITHTVVDPVLQGQGIAGKMTELAVVYLRQQGKKILPTCSYARDWFGFESNAAYRTMRKDAQ